MYTFDRLHAKLAKSRNKASTNCRLINNLVSKNAEFYAVFKNGYYNRQKKTQKSYMQK